MTSHPSPDVPHQARSRSNRKGPSASGGADGVPQTGRTDGLPAGHPELLTPSTNHAGGPTGSRPASVVIAVLAMVLVLLALLVVVFGVLAQGHGRFSMGIGLMLAIYAASMAAAAWAGWRMHRLGYGAMMGISVVNAFVVASTASSSHALWLWPVLVPVVITIGALLTRSGRAVFGRLDHLEPSD